MKNREKYREEILESAAYQKREICDFKRKEMFPHFGKEDGCTSVSCAWCNLLLGLWLDEEYVEPKKPEVDWSKVPIDTLVRVRDYEDDEWVPRYFVGIDENHKGRYVVWAGGATSKTSRGSTMHWMHCELVGDEDNDK